MQKRGYRVEDFTVKFTPDAAIPYIALSEVEERFTGLVLRNFRANQNRITFVTGQDGKKGIFTGDLASFLDWWEQVQIKGAQ